MPGAYGCCNDYILKRTSLSSAGGSPAIAEHVIQDIQRRIDECMPGDRIQTKQFEMMYKNFTLNIYLNGRKEKDRGHVSLCLEYQPHWYKGNRDKTVAVNRLIVTTKEGIWQNKSTTKNGVTELEFPKWLTHKACQESLQSGSLKIKIEMEIVKNETSWSFPDITEIFPTRIQARYWVYIGLSVLFWLALSTMAYSYLFPVGEIKPPPPHIPPVVRTAIMAMTVLFLSSMPTAVIVFIFLYIAELVRRLYTARFHTVQDKEENCALLAL